MHDGPSEIEFPALIRAIRGGSEEAAGRLLECYRPYLTMLARLRAKGTLQQRFDDSDLVQETLVQVHRGLAGFQGTTEAEFTAWMRRILASVSAKHVRHHKQQRRDATLELRLSDGFDNSSNMIGQSLVAFNSSPSEQSIKRERAVILAWALSQLPPDYREALVANRLEGLTIAQTAERMGRSVDSIQKLLARGLLELRRMLKGRI
jgi:RNA polymerase sigma-70 factor (ECF subfamily)